MQQPGALLRHPLILQESAACAQKGGGCNRRCNVTASIGLPYLVGGQVMSCTALVRGARVHAIIPAASCENPYGFLPETERCLRQRQPLTPVPRLAVAFGNELFEPEADVREGYVLMMPSSLNATAASFHEVKAALCTRSARTAWPSHTRQRVPAKARLPTCSTACAPSPRAANCSPAAIHFRMSLSYTRMFARISSLPLSPMPLQCLSLGATSAPDAALAAEELAVC